MRLLASQRTQHRSVSAIATLTGTSGQRLMRRSRCNYYGPQGCCDMGEQTRIVCHASPVETRRSLSVARQWASNSILRLVNDTKALAAQFLQQRRSLFQVGGVKAFGEPVVD